MDRAALVGRNLGLDFDFSTLGAGGGPATVCGADASGESCLGEGTTTGGVSVIAPWSKLFSPGLYADIIALRAGTEKAVLQGYRKGMAEHRAAW